MEMTSIQTEILPTDHTTIVNRSNKSNSGLIMIQDCSYPKGNSQPNTNRRWASLMTMRLIMEIIATAHGIEGRKEEKEYTIEIQPAGEIY